MSGVGRMEWGEEGPASGESRGSLSHNSEEIVRRREAMVGTTATVLERLSWGASATMMVVWDKTTWFQMSLSLAARRPFGERRSGRLCLCT